VTALVAGVAGLGVLLSMFDALPYVRDILKGTTRPHRGTWLIWSALAWLALGSNWADGASWSLLPLAAQAMLCCVIVLLSLPRGEGGLGAGELLMFGIAGLGVYTAVTFTDPTLATYGVIVADVAGALMMVPKSWRDPHSETVSTFVLTSLVGWCALVSVGELDPALMAYPAYYIVVNASIAALLLLRRRSCADSTRRRRSGWGNRHDAAACLVR
jgi:hypothetical protein